MVQYGKDIEVSLEMLEERQPLHMDFSCGNEQIDQYLHNRATEDNTGVTYLYVDKKASRVIAFCTLTCSAIFTATVEEKYSSLIPAIEINFFATDENYQHLPYDDTEGGSLSDYILDDMIVRIQEIAEKQVGASAIVLYSVPEAITFYERHGFASFGDFMFGDEGYFVDGCEPMYMML